MASVDATTEQRINSKDEFELCYLRHKYVKKCNYSPSKEEIEIYMKIAKKFVYNTYFTYLALFRSVSFSQEDLDSIARVYVVTFINLFSLDRAPIKKKEFEDSFALYQYRDADEDDILKKNKANFTLFFRQRMQDLVRVCRQKSRNVRGKVLEEYSCFCGPNRPPTNPNTILRDFEQLGFKKIDNAILKSARKKSDAGADATLFQSQGLWYVALSTDHSPLSYDEVVTGGVDQRENICYMQPDEIYQESEFKNFAAQFSNFSAYKKIKALRDFIAKYENKTYYKKELKTARSMLRKLGAHKECAQ